MTKEFEEIYLDNEKDIKVKFYWGINKNINYKITIDNLNSCLYKNIKKLFVESKYINRNEILGTIKPKKINGRIIYKFKINNT